MELNSFGDCWRIDYRVKGMVLLGIHCPQFISLSCALHDNFAVVEDVQFVFVEERCATCIS